MNKLYKENVSNFFNKSISNNKIDFNIEIPTVLPSTTRNTDEIIELKNLIETKIYEFSPANCPANIVDIFNLSKKSQGVVSFYKIISDDAFNYLNKNGYKKLNSKNANESIVIFVTSENGEKSSIYWKSRKIKEFLVLKHYSDEYNKSDKIVYEFVANSLADALSKEELGLSHHQINLQNNNEIIIQNIVDYRDYNLLLQAAESGNAEVLQALLNKGINTIANDGVSAQDLAWENRHSEVLLILAKNNLPYPEGLDTTELSDDFQSFFSEAKNLHEAVVEKNEEKIKEILNNGHKLKYYFDLSNKSAARVAIDEKAFDIYEVLITNEIFLAPHEYEQGVFNDLDYREQRLIRELHHKYSINVPNKHINILMAHSSIAHDVPDAVSKLRHIKEAYITLSHDVRLNAVLKAVAASKNFQIIFDFNRDAINIADPTAPGNAEGNFYLFGRIYIGARQLLDPKTRGLVISVLAHELCHCAVNLTYSNKAKPYKIDDNQAAAQFEEINKKCQKEVGKEKVVDVVHESYPEDVHHAELIVRPAHLIALYMDQPEKLEEVNKIFPELFEYFEKVAKEMETAIPDIERRDEKVIEEQDQKISKLRKKLILGGICSVIGIIAVALIVRLIFRKPFYKFEDLSASDKARIRDGVVSYKGIEVRFSDLYFDNSTAYSKLTSDQITQIFDGHTLNFSDPKLSFFNDMVHHEWVNLAGKLKEKFLNSEFNFQNSNVKFKDLNSEVLNYLSSEQIENVLDGKKLNVGKMIKNETKFYMERKFIFEGQAYYLAPSDYSNVHETMNEVIYRTNYRKFFILSSEAGAGKTVTFEQLTLKIKKKFPLKWVSYVELRNHTSLYDANLNTNEIYGLMENILGMDLSNEFEKKFFKFLYDSGNVEILWNGFDEISPTYSDFVIDLLNFIRETSQNVQYVCTRPLYSDRLKSEFQIFPYELLPFDQNEQREFLSGIISSQDGNTSMVDSYVDKIQNISTRLNFNTPLMLTLIANIRNNSKQLIESENLYKIYSIFVDEKIKIWHEKSPFIKTISQISFELGYNFEIRKMYQKFALLTIFPSQLQTKKLEIMNIEIPEKLPYEEISRMGIIYINTEYEFEFTHRTFAEYFVAQYFIENFYFAQKNANFDENLLILFDKLKFEPQISEILIDFLDMQPKNRYDSFSTQITKHLKTDYKNFFIYGLKAATTDIFEMYFKFFGKDRQLMLDLMKVNEPETLYTASFNPMYGPKHIDCERLREIGRKYLNDDEYSKFITGKNQKGRILYGIADSKLYHEDKIHYELELNMDILEPYLLNIFDNLKPNLTNAEQKELLIFLFSHTNWFIGLGSFESIYYKNLWENHINMLSRNETKLVIGNAINGFSQIGYYLNSRKHSTLLTFLFHKIEQVLNSSIDKNSEIYEMFKDGKMLHKATFFNTIFQIIWKFFESHSTWEQQREILQNSESYGQVWHANQNGKIRYDLDSTKFNIFHFSLFNSIKTGGSFIFVKDLYEKYFNTTEIQNIILDSNAFMVPMTAFADPDTCFQFSNFLKRIFIGNEKALQRFLLRNFEPTPYIIFDYFDGLAGFPDIKVDIFSTLLSKISERRIVDDMDIVPIDEVKD